MKSQGIVGRKIAHIKQEMVSIPFRRMNAVFEIVLDNGTVLVPFIGEGDGEYFVDFHVFKKGKR